MYLKESSVFLVSIIFRIRTRKCTKLFTENITEYFVHAQCVPGLSSVGGGGGGGAWGRGYMYTDKASHLNAFVLTVHSRVTAILCTKCMYTNLFSIVDVHCRNKYLPSAEPGLWLSFSPSSCPSLSVLI